MNLFEAVPFPKLLPDMALEARLEVVTSAIQALAHATSRGVTYEAIDLDDIARYGDGVFRVSGWDRAAPAEPRPPVRIAQGLLRRALVASGGGIPRALWKMVSHPYRKVEELAADLAAYLAGAPEVRAAQLGIRRQLAGWVRRRPALALFAIGGGVAILAALGGLGALGHAAKSADEAARREKATCEREIREARMVEVGEIVRQIEAIDLRRLERLAARRALYHSLDPLRPTREELAMDDELVALDIERAAKSQLVPEARLALDRGEFEYLFARAAFEESKVISTLTIPELQRDPAEHPDHPYHVAAMRLEAAGDFPEFTERLRPVGTLRVGELPPRTTARIRDGREFEGGEQVEVEMGEYVIDVERGEDETFVLDVLVERGEFEYVRLYTIPEGRVPEGLVWIPAGEFYRGGYGTRAGRYRKSRVERAFMIEERENAAGGNTGALPTEDQWEYAARGAAGRPYPWGDEWLPDAPGTELDRSVFGVIGLAGGSVESTSTPSEQSGWTISKGRFLATTPEGVAAGTRWHFPATSSRGARRVRWDE